MSNKLTTNMKTLVNNNTNAYDIVLNGAVHTQRKALAEMVSLLGIKSVKQFIKFNFEQYDISNAKLYALTNLQARLNKYMSNSTAGTPVAKKKVAKKVKAKKVAKKKAVAKKKVSNKQSIKDKYMKMYKIVSVYSDTLLQDVYNVVYKGGTLKRFVNTNLANKFIEQEVLLKMNEYSIRTAKKNRAIVSELAAEFE